ncbi:MAG: extracellular solute-binding protein [Clostridia bacterium]|nr:extracellular solute-binding protein [Clostridia bacterium]
MKKSLSLLLAAMLLLSCMSLPAALADDTVKLTICSPDNTFGISTDPDLQQAVVSMLEEACDVQLEAIIPPIGSYNDKLETMMAGGDVPDIFAISQAMTRLPNYVAREQPMKLNDLIAGSEALSAIDSTYFTALEIGGGIYAIPYYYPRVKSLFLRKDLMEQYDIQLSETPTTEEFIAELSKLKDTGIIPFSFPKWIDNFQYFLNSFGAYAGIYKNADGVFVDGMQEEAMIDGLNYLRELYTSGVMDQEFITTENNTMREYVYTGKAACDIDYVANYSNYISQSAAAGAPTDVQPIYMLVGPNGLGGGLNESIQTAWCISSECKNPEAAMRVIEKLVTDPAVHAAFYNTGVEGAHYTIENGIAVATEKATNSGYAIKYNYITDSFIPDFSTLPYQPDETMKAALELQRQIIDRGMELRGDKQMIPAGKSDLYDENAASITSYWKEVISQIVLGSVTVEEGLKNYKNFWDSVEGDQILAELNAN